jgi:hypothetical protein
MIGEGAEEACVVSSAPFILLIPHKKRVNVVYLLSC